MKPEETRAFFMSKYLVIIFLCIAALWWRYNQQPKLLETNTIVDQQEENLIVPSESSYGKTLANEKGQSTESPKFNQNQIKELEEQSHDPSFLPFDQEGNLYIENVAIDGEWAIVHGDVLVGSTEDIMRLEQEGGNLFLRPPQLWEEGVVPYLIEPAIAAAQEREIDIAIKTINAKTNVKFKPKTNEKDFVIFKSGGEHCYSNVGRIGGEQFIVLNPKCRHPQILHEMLHALGLYHEQSRPDRDDYVMVMWENIEERYHEQFKKMPPLHHSITDTNFDLKSIMMYPPEAFARELGSPSMLTINGEHYEPEQSLSEGDIKKLEVLYKN